MTWIVWVIMTIVRAIALRLMLWLWIQRQYPDGYYTLLRWYQRLLRRAYPQLRDEQIVAFRRRLQLGTATATMHPTISTFVKRDQQEVRRILREIWGDGL